MSASATAMLDLFDTGLPGCFELRFRRHEDPRGSFLKNYQEDAFRSLGLRTDWREEYITTSRKNVIRGMHFQVPPMQHAKLVTCLAGRVLDVVLDLREGSPAFGKWISLELDARTGRGIYIPEGMAHGFLSLEEGSMLHYKVTSVHAPDQDQGLLWSSIGFDWPVGNPVVSVRDASFPSLAGFQTPFRT